MKLYFDTSIFVPMTTHEDRTEDVLSWFADQALGSVVISDWVVAEYHSAMSFKIRTGQITSDTRDGAEVLFLRYAGEFFQVLEVTREDFRRAGDLAGDIRLKLRAGDALHLAIAERHGMQLCTLDRALFGAADKIGVSAFTV